MRAQLVVAAIAALFATSAYAADHAVEIKGMKFNPPSLQVAAGDTITFTNSDPMAHTATAADGSFDTGRLGKGESATVTVPAGDHAYACAIHTSMKGSVSAQ